MEIKNKLSFISLLACYSLILYTAFFFYPRWERQGYEATLSWDVSGYYMYLPATFIYKDLKHCGFKDSIIQKYQPTSYFEQAFIHQPSGNHVMKYAIGQSLTMLPWFAAGHAIATLSNNYPPDGFSFPYQVSIGIGMLLYALIGIYFLRKILLHYFSDGISGIVLFAIVFGSNYLNYAAIDQAMSHNTLFTVYTLLIWFTIRFYKNYRLRDALVIGFLCGLACLIRPTEIISLMVPVVWGISRFRDMKNRIKLFFTQSKNILAATILFILTGSVQLIYWKWATGDWLVYSYQEQGFSWLRQHFFAYNFSYKSGWLRYCPMMLLPFLGIYPLYKYRLNFFAVTGMMLLSWYIVTAWDIWDYGGRAMVQYYPFFAIALAAYLLWIKGIKILKILTALFMLLSLYLNIWWVYHAHKGEVLVSNLTKAYYQRMVGRWHSTDDDTKLLDNEYSYRGVMKNKQLIYENNFDIDSSANYVNVAGNGMLILNDLLHQTINYIVKAPAQKQAWIRAYTTFHTGIKEWNEWQQTQFIINFYNEDSVIQTNLIRIHRLVGDNDHKEIYIDAKCPEKWTQLSIDYQNFQSDKEVKMDSLKVFTFSDN